MRFSVKKQHDAEIIGYIYRPYIVRNGRIIYPKRAKVFRIPIYAERK